MYLLYAGIKLRWFTEVCLLESCLCYKAFCHCYCLLPTCPGHPQAERERTPPQMVLGRVAEHPLPERSSLFSLAVPTWGSAVFVLLLVFTFAWGQIRFEDNWGFLARAILWNWLNIFSPRFRTMTAQPGMGKKLLSLSLSQINKTKSGNTMAN